mgnify:CR=1 FL=1
MRKTETALLIIDMQRDFVDSDSPLRVSGAAATVPRIAELLSFCRARADVAVFHIVRGYEPDGLDLELVRLRRFQGVPGAIRATRGAEIVSSLRPAPGEPVIEKPRFSAFFQTRLDLCLRRLGVRTVLLAGTQWPNCIRATATDALSLDYDVVAIVDCCSAASEEIAQANIRDLRNLGARCLALAEWMKSPRPA